MKPIMRGPVRIDIINQMELESLRPLVDEFIRTHNSFNFRPDYWESFFEWLNASQTSKDILSLYAKIGVNTVGFVIGIVQKNGPLIFPEKLGYVSIMVVDKAHRGMGIGTALWTELRSWFLSKDIEHLELYTEFGNSLSSTFWENRGFTTFLERRRLPNQQR